MKHHRTYGVSLSPDLHQRARSRATALGLTLSRYIQQCLEAELQGRTRLFQSDATSLSDEISQLRADLRSLLDQR